MNKKTVALLLALTLVFGASVGGTLAWLTAQSNKVVNTFTSSNIDIDLTETAGEGSNEAVNGVINKSFAMIPGYQVAKDPMVTVEKNSEDCYLFVKLEKSSSYGTYMENYNVITEWTKLTGVTLGENEEVYYRVVKKNTEKDQTFQVLVGDGKENSEFAGGYLTVKSSVTKAQMDALAEENAVQPSLTITAYATQYYQANNSAFEPSAAWAAISNPANQ